jgi:putative ABC transport system ATP-binding protein
MSDLVSLAGVAKHYTRGKHTVEVLKGVNLRVAKGEFIALMGPSGSGKTTLLNLIAGLDRPDAGQIEVAGTRLEGKSGSDLCDWRARNVGFIFQFYNLLPTLSAAANVEVPMLLTRLSRGERRKHVHAALALVGLGDRMTHKPQELSGGQQQRVSIARAIAADPALLVCDEPTGDLDRENAEQILDLLQVLSRQHGKTIIMVTHDPRAAARASRQIYMDKGQLSATVIAEAA